jgi:hypothetical protein
MKNFEIHCNNNENHQKRSSKSLIIISIISIILAVVVTLKSNWIDGLGFGLLIFSVQFFKSNRWDRYYILSIVTTPTEIELIYDKRGEKKAIKDLANLFEFKKKTAFSKSRIVYLAIFYKGDLIVEQSEDGEWNEEKFDEVLNATDE